MFQSYVINRKLKTEFSKVTPTVRIMKELQRSKEHKNYSFEYSTTYDQLPKKLRCQSTYSKLCGFRSQKYQLFHDIVSEFAEHKKQRLANVIIQNLKKSSLPSQGSARNLFAKSGPNLNHNYSQFMKKVKDFKISEQNVITQTALYSYTHLNQAQYMKTCLLQDNPQLNKYSTQNKPLLSVVQENKVLRCSSVFYTTQLLEPQQFVLKSKFKTNNALEKILTEARNQIKTSQSPRSVHISLHKKTKSHPTNVYTEQNKLLQRVILKTKLNQ